MESKRVRKHLGPIGWVKAKILAARLRRKWNNDPEWREKFQAAVSAGVKAKMQKRNK